MARAIIKLDGKYLVWSSIMDSPISFGMTRKQLERWLREEEARNPRAWSGSKDEDRLIARADACGTSARGDKSADDTIWLNAAGPDEGPLSKAEIIEFFVRRRREPTAAQIRKRRAKLPKCSPCTWDQGRRCQCFGTRVRDAEAART